MTRTDEDILFMLQVHQQGQTIPCRHCNGNPAGCAKCYRIGADFCDVHCPVCEGMDHHWMPDCDEYSGEPRMVCKHCEAIREYTEWDE
jgi:hypothetical protein